MMIVSFENVFKTYGDKANSPQTVALKDVSLQLNRGEVVVLLGPSGCGKTTLLKLLAGFEKPTAGRVRANGETVQRPGPDRGIIFQAPTLFPWLTTIDNVLYGPRVLDKAGAEVIENAYEILRTVGLEEFAAHLPHNLSGGMQQRVAIARVLINKPTLLLADEPFAALDEYTRRSMQELFLRVAAVGQRTLLFVTHSVEEAVYLADRIVVMSPRPGRIRQIIDVNIPRTRERSSRAFLDTMGAVFRAVEEDQQSASAAA